MSEEMSQKKVKKVDDHEEWLKEKIAGYSLQFDSSYLNGHPKRLLEKCLGAFQFGYIECDATGHVVTLCDTRVVLTLSNPEHLEMFLLFLTITDTLPPYIVL